QTADTGLQLTATNLEIGIRQVIPAEVQEEGGITVPARLLTDFVTSHPDEPLSMALDKKTQSLAVKSNRFDATIRGIDPADFPPVPSGVEGRKVKVDQAELKDAIEQTVIAASSDEGRPVLTGAYVHLNGGKATFAATDHHQQDAGPALHHQDGLVVFQGCRQRREIQGRRRQTDPDGQYQRSRAERGRR